MEPDRSGGGDCCARAGYPWDGQGILHRAHDAQAAAFVRSTVTNTRPVLLPSSPPAWAYDATVRAGPDDFEIDYQSDLRDKTMTFGILVANPPPGG
jgi:hypothetical protein